jgi:hypothetical protein
MPRDGVVDEFDHLLGLDPTMRMEDEVEDAPLDDDRVQDGLKVRDRPRIVGLLNMLRLPIAGHDARKLPAGWANRIRIGIIFDRVHEGRKRQILTKTLLAVGVVHDVARQGGVVGREDVEDGRIDRQGVSRVRPFLEDLGEKAGTHRIARVATGHPKGDGPVADDPV